MQGHTLTHDFGDLHDPHATSPRIIRDVDGSVRETRLIERILGSATAKIEGKGSSDRPALATAGSKVLPDQIYPGEVFEFLDDNGDKQIGSNTTIFPVVLAGGRASLSAQRTISIACHLFDIDNVAVVHHTDCGGTHFTPEGLFASFKEEFDQDISDLWDADDICLESFALSLHRDVRSIRNSRGTPKHVNVYGYLYDILTGELHLVEESRGDPTAPRGAAWR